MMETRKIEDQQIKRECALCGFTTTETIVVCPEDGSALVTIKPDPFVGTTLVGRFDIESLIGSGGMGNVYKATQRVVERHVAVKILHSEKLNKRDAVLRFQQEARAAAALSHNNIVGFFDFGLTEDNVPFIVMDYVQGVSLFEMLKQSTLNADRCTKIFAQVCDALQHAHDKGIIHRDIKPSNIMLVKTPEQDDLVKILDFGIAKLLPQYHATNRVTLTQTGELFGSPQYMSPEQFAGQPLDARSDMYAVGCVMYESLTGKAPVTGDSIIELIQKHTHERPAPLRAVKPDVDAPAQLEAIIFKTLEKDPEQRFPSMGALKHNLEFVHKFAEDERNRPVTAGGSPQTGSLHPSLPAGGSPLSKGTKIWIVASIGIVGVTVAAFAGLLYFVNPQGDNSVEDALLWMRLKFTEALDPGNDMRRLQLIEKLRDSYAKEGFGNVAMTYADKAVSQANAMNLKDWTAANEFLRRAQIQERFQNGSAGHSFSEALSALRSIAENNRKHSDWTGNLDDTKPVDAAVVDLERKLNPQASTSLPTDIANMAEDLRRAGSIDKAETLYQQLCDMKDQLTEPQQLQLADSLKQLADVLASRGKEQAETFYKTAIELKSKIKGGQTDDVANLQRALGLYYKNHEQITKAESTLMDALAIAQAAGGEHSDLAISLYNDLGEVYRQEKEFDKATEMFKLAERLRQK